MSDFKLPTDREGLERELADCEHYVEKYKRPNLRDTKRLEVLRRIIPEIERRLAELPP